MAAHRSQSPGFASPFLLFVVLVLSVVGFLAYQYWQSHNAGDAETATAKSGDISTGTSDSSDDRTRHDGADNEPEQQNSVQSFFASLFNDEKENVYDEEQASPLIEKYQVPQFSAAEHTEWVQTFHTQLYSPEPAPDIEAVEEEEAAPVISGRVLTQYGAPVEGIEVTARFRDYFKTTDSIARKKAAGTQTTTTNENGFYAFRGLPEGIYLVETQDSGYYAAGRSEVRTGVKYADLVLNAQRHAQVRGVVTDPMGTAIGGVRIMPLVKGIPAGAVSDAYGEFQFAVALETEKRSFPVRLQREGYQQQRHQVTAADWAADGSMALAVTMEPVYEFAMFSGSLTDTDGVQIGGETVRLYSPGLQRNYRAVADDGGEFEFAKVELADDYQLWVRPTGPYRDYTEQNLALTPGSLRRSIELESLHRGHRLRGRILDQDGKPVPNFTLTVHSKAASGQKLAVTSNAYGRYEVANVPEGELVFESRTMPYYTVSGVQLAGNDTDRDLDLVVNRGKHKLLGKVVDSDGRPVASPRIFITASTSLNGLRSQSSSSTSADFDGRFLFTELGAGQHTVTVNAPGYEGVRLQPVVGNQTELVVRLEKKST